MQELIRWIIKEFDRDSAKLSRSVAVPANYPAQGRPDIEYSVKEICRHMSKPMQQACRSLKRSARYLITALGPSLKTCGRAERPKSLVIPTVIGPAARRQGRVQMRDALLGVLLEGLVKDTAVCDPQQHRS